MRHEERAQTWFGGIFRQHNPHGLARPEVAAWISDSGDLLGMIAVSPGRGGPALEDALQAALRRRRLQAPARLAVQDDRLHARLRQHIDLPIEPVAHGRFDSVVGAALEQIAGTGSSAHSVERAVSHAHARALFLGSQRLTIPEPGKPGTPRQRATPGARAEIG